MCEAADGATTSQSGQSLVRSMSQLAAALATGAFNMIGFLIFPSTPSVLLWLIWFYPYIILPPVIAIYFLSRDGVERKDGRPWPTFAKHFWIFRLARGYHDLQLHLDPKLEPSNMTGDEKFVFALHPHGVTADYRILMDGIVQDYFPKLRSWRALAASVLFQFPLWRQVALWSHCIDAGRATAQYTLDRGHSLFIVPGGEHEQVLCEFGKEILYLKSRMGFVKLALRNGTPLVPVYVFGASDVYRTSTFLRPARLALVSRMRVGFPLFWGRFGLPIPREVPIRIVFGAPLALGTYSDKNTEKMTEGTVAGGPREVSDEELTDAHGAYVEALKRLFDDNKARFGYADRELQIL